MRVVALSWLCAGVACAILLSGRGVVSLAGSVAGAAVDVTGAVVSTGFKTTGAVVGAVLPN